MYVIECSKEYLQLTAMKKNLTLTPVTGNINMEIEKALRVKTKTANDFLLDYIKDLCYMLSLDPDYTSRITSMKRQLLRKIQVWKRLFGWIMQVHEFSSSAQFEEPFSSLLLPGVICTHCHHYRDIDICRDADIQTVLFFLLEWDVQAQKGWFCLQCHNKYNMKYIELKLIQKLNSYVNEFNSQVCGLLTLLTGLGHLLPEV